MFKCTLILRMWVALGIMMSIAACSPEVGSQAWCAQMKAKPKGEWTVNEAADYARFCLLK